MPGSISLCSSFFFCLYYSEYRLFCEYTGAKCALGRAQLRKCFQIDLFLLFCNLFVSEFLCNIVFLSLFCFKTSYDLLIVYSFFNFYLRYFQLLA